jgi:NAD(P)-dependent dehydrogenase (short-subunit alcohol dehydrogenase family)
MEFKDKSVVVTGGAQGIGKCTAGGMTRNMIYHNDFGWRLEK